MTASEYARSICRPLDRQPAQPRRRAFCTPDQDEYDRAVSAARRALVEHGLIVGHCPNGARVPDGHVLAIAALLDALDSTAR